MDIRKSSGRKADIMNDLLSFGDSIEILSETQADKDVLLREARERIPKVRMKQVTLRVLHAGVPVSGARIVLRMKKHEFLFGAVPYSHGTFGSPEKEARFTKAFTRLFNYTMVPFHWSWYEPEKGVYAEPKTGDLVRWCEENDLKKKLHALIWHWCCPDWLKDGQVESEYERRISHLMEAYGDRFDFFDLGNEITVIDQFDNPVVRWIRGKGASEVMKFGSSIVRSYQPDAKLVYGDWNVHGKAYEKLLTEFRDNGVDIDYIGMQAHMHRDKWTLSETKRVMDRAAAFGWPIHFPEISIMSGQPIGEMSYEPGAVNHYTETEDDRAWQAAFTEEFYTMLFSHPSVEAISWFDFTDHRWLGAPAGLVDDDLDPKPAYGTLDRLINREWHSDADLLTSGGGLAGTRLFFGHYEAEVTLPNGTRFTTPFDLYREHFYEETKNEAPALITLEAP